MIRTIAAVRNVRYANPQKTSYYLEVDFNELDENYTPFHAVPTDTEAHGVLLYNNCKNGVYGTVGDFLPDPDITGDDAREHLRIERDNLIAVSDWRGNSDVPMSNEWQAYRQALRDLPQNNPNPVFGYIGPEKGYGWKNVTFPTEPS